MNTFLVPKYMLKEDWLYNLRKKVMCNVILYMMQQNWDFRTRHGLKKSFFILEIWNFLLWFISLSLHYVGIKSYFAIVRTCSQIGLRRPTCLFMPNTASVQATGHNNTGVIEINPKHETGQPFYYLYYSDLALWQTVNCYNW